MVILSKRMTFSSVEAMRTQLEGVYAKINGSSQAIIDGDSLIWRMYIDEKAIDVDYEIEEWNPKRGYFVAEGNKVVVMRWGELRWGKDDYYRLGSLTDSPREDNSTNNQSYSDGYTDIKVEVDSFVKSQSYLICSGNVSNSGKKTYYFVEVKAVFYDSSGKVIDTDYTYAVGKEGLAPGESSKFEMYISYDERIESCSVSLLDFN